MVPLSTSLVTEMKLNVATLPAWMRNSCSLELVVRLRAFRYAKPVPAVVERPLVQFKDAKHVISIRRFSSKGSKFREEVHESALNHMLRLYSLARASMTVTNFDIQVSARQSMTIPCRASAKWHPIMNAVKSIRSGEGVIILLHGCDALSTDIWSIQRLYDYHKSICIYLIIKEQDGKLLDGLDTELRERIISHWREGTDGFHYGRFRLADIIDCWSKDEGDLTDVDLPATHLISLWQEAYASRLRLCKGYTKVFNELKGSSKILLSGRNMLSKP